MATDKTLPKVVLPADVIANLRARAPWSAGTEVISFETLMDYLRAIDLGRRWEWVGDRGWSPSDRHVDRMSQILRKAGLIEWIGGAFYTTTLGKQVLQMMVTGLAHPGGSDGG